MCDIDAGTCVAESAIVYASPQSGPGATCSLTDPCGLPTAIAFAETNSLRSTVRMLPGLYGETIDITNDVSTAITIIGTGATHAAAGPEAFKVGNDSRVTIRGLSFDLTRGNLRCDPSPGLQRPMMQLRDVAIRLPTASGRLWLKECQATLTNVDMTNQGQLGMVYVLDGATVDVDRSRFSSAGRVGFFSMLGQRISAYVTNSIFVNVTVSPNFGNDATPSSVRFGFNTAVMLSPTINDSLIHCENTGNATVLVENNVLRHYQDGAVVGTGCSLNHNLMYVQTSPLAGTNIFADPRFVDENGDYHLMPNSPALDIATPSGSLDTNHDFAGSPRPQGTGKDIGAYEMKP